MKELKNPIKLSDWAKEQDIKYMNAYRWFNKGYFKDGAIKDEFTNIWVEKDFNPASLLKENLTEDSEVSLPSPSVMLNRKFRECERQEISLDDLSDFLFDNFVFEYSKNVESKKPKIKALVADPSSHFNKFISKEKKPEDTKLWILTPEEAAKLNINDGVKSVKEQAQATKNKFSTALNNLTPKNNYSNDKIDSVASEDEELADNLPIHAANANSSSSKNLIPDSSGLKTGFIKYGEPFESNPELEVDIEEEDIGPDLNPVLYEEAKVLAMKILPNGTDDLILDQKAKQFCLLDRDSFDLLVKTFKPKSKK